MKDILEKIMNEFINSDDHFCSEADFQFSLAWRIKEELKNAEIILEYPIKNDNNKHQYIDICVINDNKKHFIELKYKTKKVVLPKHEINDFELADQYAHDLGRYHFCKDIERLEKINEKHSTNYAIFLTNDPLYCIDENPDKDTLDKEFKIFEGKKLTDKLNWKEISGPHWTNKEDKHGNKKYKKIELTNQYQCNWNKHEKSGDNAKYNKYYLLLEVPPQKEQ